MRTVNDEGSKMCFSFVACGAGGKGGVVCDSLIKYDVFIKQQPLK